MSIEQLEQRLFDVESAIAKLQSEVERNAPSEVKLGLHAIVGSMADFPEFEDVMEFVNRQREEELAAFDAVSNTP